jgi:hypothetical protein
LSLSPSNQQLLRPEAHRSATYSNVVFLESLIWILLQAVVIKCSWVADADQREGIVFKCNKEAVVPQRPMLAPLVQHYLREQDRQCFLAVQVKADCGNNDDDGDGVVGGGSCD